MEYEVASGSEKFVGEPTLATMGNVFSRKKELSQRVPTMKSKRFNSRHISLNEVTESQSRNVVETDTGLRKINQYKFNSVIGRGSFGEVWLATDDHNISYAIKVLKRSMLRKKRTGMASNALDAVLREHRSRRVWGVRSEWRMCRVRCRPQLVPRPRLLHPTAGRWLYMSR